MDKHTQDMAFFVSFCIEQYKVKHSLSGEQTMQVFDKHGVMEYLCNHYEVLHTQNSHWLVEEIEEFIENNQQ